MVDIVPEGITTGELDLIRTHQEAYLPDTILIRRKSFAGAGEYHHKTIGEDVPARIMPGWGMWQSVADRYQGVTAFTLTVAHDQDIQAADEVVDQTSRVFQVRDVKQPGSLLTARQCLVDLVTDG